MNLDLNHSPRTTQNFFIHRVDIRDMLNHAMYNYRFEYYGVQRVGAFGRTTCSTEFANAPSTSNVTIDWRVFRSY
jgi:hypothetical protein